MLYCRWYLRKYILKCSFCYCFDKLQTWNAGDVSSKRYAFTCTLFPDDTLLPNAASCILLPSPLPGQPNTATTTSDRGEPNWAEHHCVSSEPWHFCRVLQHHTIYYCFSCGISLPFSSCVYPAVHTLSVAWAYLLSWECILNSALLCPDRLNVQGIPFYPWFLLWKAKCSLISRYQQSWCYQWNFN